MWQDKKTKYFHQQKQSFLQENVDGSEYGWLYGSWVALKAVVAYSECFA